MADMVIFKRTDIEIKMKGGKVKCPSAFTGKGL